jgi:PAS domain S-box-containing protein
MSGLNRNSEASTTAKGEADRSSLGLSYEKRLEAAHQRYRVLFEASLDPVLITDQEGRIVEANQQAEVTTGFKREDWHSLSIGDLHRIEWRKVGAKFKKLDARKMITYESVLHSQAGRDIPIQVYVCSIPYEGERQLQWILRVITEHKNLDNPREDLIAMVYHDLRSPLMNTLSSLEALSSMPSIQEDATARALFGIALRSTERIERLTNSLLDIHRLEAGQAVGPCRPVPPGVLLQDALEATRFAINTKRIQISINLPPHLPEVMVDEDIIRRVLINLIENAVKFTSVEGRIQVGARRERGAVLFYITDSGPGIPASEHERIFDKYTRLQASQGTKGLGLGLAFCRLAVTGHGGRIWVKSKAGEGATFKFTVPIAPDAGSQDNLSTEKEWFE